jgi:excinuclease ABC subunit B
MYADKITPAMAKAIDETNRRRAKQVAYNTENGIDPTPLRKKIADITDSLIREDEDTRNLLGRPQGKGRAPVPGLGSHGVSSVDYVGKPAEELEALIEDLSQQMHTAAAELQFELAARFRDEISELKKELRGMRAAGV